MSDDSHALYIEISPGERRAALEGSDGRIAALWVERDGTESQVGAIVQARVATIDKGMGAAFLDLGGMGEAMLPRAKGLTEGEKFPVQVIRDASGGKGLAVGRKLMLTGRGLGYIPSGKGMTFAANIGQGRRKALAETRVHEAFEHAKLPADGGFAVKAPASAMTADGLAMEAETLTRIAAEITKGADSAAPGTLFQPAPDFVSRLLLDAPPETRVAIDDRRAFAALGKTISVDFPDLARDFVFYGEAAPLFETCGGEEALENALARTLPIPGGGRLTIDRTEALWAVDVDSGAGGAGETQALPAAQRLNKRAAEEIARQIRLRDMSGLIVVDFASLPGRGKLKEVADILKGALKRFGGPGVVDVLGVTAAGLVEVTRQRQGPPLGEIMLSSKTAPEPRPDAEAAAALRAALRLTGAGKPIARVSGAAITCLEKGALKAAKAETDRRLGQPLTLERRDRAAGPDARMSRD